MANQPSKQRDARVSVVVTVLNEALTVDALINSLASQSLSPTRVVIIDGGSTDGTLQKIQQYPNKVPFELVCSLVPGNRSVGRNAAIRSFIQTPLVAITDAGCVLDEQWLESLVQTWRIQNVPVVAGYYATLPSANLFQKAAAPFFLVMPDKVNVADFLPATRSMLLESAVWESVGGFDEQLSDNEDYAFANLLKKTGFSIGFSSQALAYWSPPKSLAQFWWTIFRFARGDVVANLYRPKVALLFLRYILGLCVLIIALQPDGAVAAVLVAVLFALYLIWAIAKLKKYVPLAGVLYLPLLQITADFAVISGSVFGMLRKLEKLLPSQE